MIFTESGLRGYKLQATDGDIGHVHDFLFDDEQWMVRYLVADTGWIFGRRVLLVPEALGHPRVETNQIPVSLTKDKIKASPDIDTDKPVSRRHEESLYGFYGWTPYWSAATVPPGYAEPVLAPVGPRPAPEPVRPPKGDPHLRSMREVDGYAVAARDGELGTVSGFLIDDDRWRVRYLIVDTGNWLPGRKVVLAPHWGRGIDWAERRLAVGLTRDKIRDAPDYDPNVALDRRYEERLYGYYGYPGYW